MTATLAAEDWRDAFNERAAIIEFDAGLDGAEAEARAMGELLEMIAGLTDATNAASLAYRRKARNPFIANLCRIRSQRLPTTTKSRLTALSATSAIYASSSSRLRVREKTAQTSGSRSG